MRPRLFSLLCVLGALGGAVFSQTSPETIAAPASPAPFSAAWFLQYHNEHVAQFRAENATLSQASSERNVVLLGDSLTEGWNFNRRTPRFLPGYRIVNRGISADTVGRERGILGRLRESVFDCNPGQVFFLAGVNDLGDLSREGAPPLDDVVATYHQIVETIRRERPDVDLCLITCSPVGGSHVQLTPLILDLNEHIRSMAAEFDCRLIDLFPLLADEQQHIRPEFTTEGLHFRDAAYRVLGGEICRVLEETGAPNSIDAWAGFPHAVERLREFRAENAALPTSPEARNVILLGSSTMEGWKNGDRVTRFLPPEFHCLNRGISADRIGVGKTGILHRLDDSVFDCNPSHVIIQNGTNDLLVSAREGSPSVERIADTYRQVVETIQREEPDVVVCITTVQPLRGRFDIGNEKTVEFNARLRQIARELNCPLIDHYVSLVDDEGKMREDLTGDGLHFNDEGYRMFGEGIARVLRGTSASPEAQSVGSATQREDPDVAPVPDHVR